MAQYTSSEANKLLRKTQEMLSAVEAVENKSAVFHAASTENPEDFRPPYDYAGTQDKIDALSAKIRKIKHAINKFNVETEVPGFGMTIDQMLIYLPQLQAKKRKLSGMSIRLKRQRVASTYGRSNIIDYEVINYPIEEVKSDYEKVSEELAAAQNALDKVNTTLTMEIDI